MITYAYYMIVLGKLYMSFSMKIVDLHWADGSKDDEKDLCLHGKVCVKIAGKTIDDGKNDSWTLSASALRMLDSLYRDHIQGNEEHFLPCCGHFMFRNEDTGRFVISGCENGIDWSVIHMGNDILLTTSSGQREIIAFSEYKRIIIGFADEIEAFYESCSPKVFYDDFDKQTYHEFWNEWHTLRNIE